MDLYLKFFLDINTILKNNNQLFFGSFMIFGRFNEKAFLTRHLFFLNAVYGSCLTFSIYSSFTCVLFTLSLFFFYLFSFYYL